MLWTWPSLRAESFGEDMLKRCLKPFHFPTCLKSGPMADSHFSHKLLTLFNFWEHSLFIVEFKTSHCRELELGHMGKNKIL